MVSCTCSSTATPALNARQLLSASKTIATSSRCAHCWSALAISRIIAMLKTLSGGFANVIRATRSSMPKWMCWYVDDICVICGYELLRHLTTNPVSINLSLCLRGSRYRQDPETTLTLITQPDQQRTQIIKPENRQIHELARL